MAAVVGPVPFSVLHPGVPAVRMAAADLKTRRIRTLTSFIGRRMSPSLVTLDLRAPGIAAPPVGPTPADAPLGGRRIAGRTPQYVAVVAAALLFLSPDRLELIDDQQVDGLAVVDL